MRAPDVAFALPVLAPLARSFVEHGRRGAKVLAERILPRSWVVWRGRTPQPGSSRIALTFDDGPNPLTPAYLDMLERLDVRATFFVVGEQCLAYPELLKEVVARGHELAGHGFSHRPFTELSQDELRAELIRTTALLPPGRDGRVLVRPPFGAMSPRTLYACASAGFTTVLWSLNSGDWRSSEAETVVRVVADAGGEAGDIVLLHEGQPWTVESLPAIVESFRKAGHELVTVGELLA